MISVYLEALKEFEALTGTPFRDESYTSPTDVPAHLLPVVRKLKISQAIVRQMEILHDIQQYNRGNVAILPDDKKHLTVDFEFWKKQAKLWEA